jgi:hypothetical protein
MNNRRFTVVEMAGYEGERDIRSFDTLREAMDFMDNQYSEEERDQFHDDCLHPDIRQDWEDEDGEEHSEYVY